MRATVFADDLSGANTTAALFRSRGWVATVHLGSVPSSGDAFAAEEPGENQVHVWNAGTRNASVSEATRVFHKLMDDFGDETRRPAFRIDSTLRGPITASLDALLDKLPGHIAMVVPAYPDSGRTTEGAVQYVHSVPVDKTPIGADPFAPVHSSDLREWIGRPSRYSFVHMPLQLLRGNQVELLKFLSESVQQGVRIILCDATTNTDIYRLAETAAALLDQGYTTLPVDPGPFTVAYMACTDESADDAEALVFGVSASLMHNARVQMDYLEYTVGLPMIHYRGQPVDEVISQMRQVVRKLAHKRTGFPIRPCSSLFLRTDTWKMDGPAAQSAVEQLPAVLAATVREFPSLCGFYLSGGEAAATILSGLGVTTLRMEMEIAPLTTMSRPLDGLLANKLVITKGGAIGDDTAVLDSLIKLHEVIKLQKRNGLQRV